MTAKKEASQKTTLRPFLQRAALILGTGAAGLQAALDLADAGVQVHLVESSPFLGGGASLLPDSSVALPPYLLKTRWLEVSRHPNIRLWTNARPSRVERKPGRFHVELRQHPRYVDLSKCTACGECVTVCPVVVPSSDDRPAHKAIYLDGQPGCMAIEKIGKPPCSNTCPGGIHVQGYVALIAQGRFQEAIDLIRQAIPFPGICGRVCTHPCEVNCRRAEIDQPVAVRLLKRFVADWELTNGVQEVKLASPPPPSRPQKVAVVGAGPGGMAVADRLARLGYPVTVFERLPIIGGMMAVGIPEYRLPRQVIAREYQAIQNLGIEIRLNTVIGSSADDASQEHYTLDELFEMGYQAVCLAIGAHRSQGLHIPGEDLPGVVHGIELLKIINFSRRLEDPHWQTELQRLLRCERETRVAVLGGGNTAMDVARSLRRLGLQDVRILYRRTRREMPAMPEEIEDAEQEGVRIEYLVAPVRILGDAESGVTGLECIRMKLGEPDASGRCRPVPIAGSEFTLDLDLIVLAIGQIPDLDFLGQNHGIAVTREERINVSDVSFMTSRPGVFAVGDAVTTDKMVVIEAIGMGKQAAAAIDAYLRGQLPQQVVVDARQSPIARREIRPDELTPKPRIPVPTLSIEQRLAGYAEVELGYSAEQAIAEAQRCLACGPCSECMACVQVCKTGAILHEQQESFAELDVGAVIYADAPGGEKRLALKEGRGCYRVPPEDALLGSAAAARLMLDLSGLTDLPTLRVPAPLALAGPSLARTPRIGVLICCCGPGEEGAISRFVDVQTACRQSASLPGVVYAGTLDFSCSAQAAQTLCDLAQTHALNRLVLAACSCCANDQVCYSCTYQRVRCKNQLGLFAWGTAEPQNFELVNIREQCAWVHQDDRQAATVKAIALIKGAVARARLTEKGAVRPRPMDRSALILGTGAAGRTCQTVLGGLGIRAQVLGFVPSRVRRSQGRYLVENGILSSQGNEAFSASALILAPCSPQEANRLLSLFGQHGLPLRIQTAWGRIESRRPGIYYCDSAQDPLAAGAATAARVAAWLERSARRLPLVAVVDPARCRACSTCLVVCEFGAPELIETRGQLASWIDPAICTGCGNCMPRCSSGAITIAGSTDAQLEAVLGALLEPSMLV